MKRVVVLIAVAALVAAGPKLIAGRSRAETVAILRERGRAATLIEADDSSQRLLDGLFDGCARPYTQRLGFYNLRGHDGRRIELVPAPVDWCYAALPKARLLAVRYSSAGIECFVLDADGHETFRDSELGEATLRFGVGERPTIEFAAFGDRALVAIDDDRLVPLSRLQGKAPRFPWTWSFSQRDLDRLPRRSFEEWEKLLDSKDRTEVLEALAWLGGRFPREDLSAPLRKRESVKMRIEKLTASSDEWIAGSARLVLERVE